MDMNIKNFEDVINPVIYDRGYDLYHGLDFSKFKKEGLTYSLVAHGTRDYDVSATLNEDDDIIDFHCSCPYNHGPVCKHVALLLIAISSDDELDFADDEEEELLDMDDRVREIIGSLDRKTLEDLLFDLISKDVDLFRMLTYRFDHDDNRIKLARQSVREALEMIDTDDFGFYDDDLPWDEAREIVDAIFTEAEKSPSLSTSVKLIQAVMREAMLDNSYETDFSTVVLDDSFYFLNAIIDKHEGDEEACCEIYLELDRMLHEDPPVIFDFSIGDYLLAMSRTRCPKTKDGFFKILNTFLDDPGTNDHVLNKIEIAMYRHMSVFSDEKTSKDYLHGHLENEELLMLAYERAMNEKDYFMAVHCANMALERHEREFGRATYERMLINALMASGDFEQAKPLLRKHVLKGDLEAYRLYIDLFEGNEKEREVDALLDDFMEIVHMESLFKIIAVEQDRLERLMLYTEKYPYTVVETCDVLMEGFRDRVCRVFEHVVFEKALNASDRRDYREIASVISRAKQVLGSDADAFAHGLIEKYPRKSALKDELRKNSGVAGI
jgi:hypothetical protein